MPNPLIYGSAYIIIFYHLKNKRLFCEYRDFLLAELKAGRLCPFYYAILIDSMRYHESDGTSTVFASTLSVKDANRRIIERNRKKIGLNNYCFHCSCYRP